jgi:IS4 transposase
LLVNHRNQKKRTYAVLFSTDVDLPADKIFEYYKSRFQIEFLFRDAKQHCGLCDCQSTKKESLDFHFNASLSTINIAKVEALKKHNMKEEFIFSMASIKRIAYNETT